MSVSVLSRSLLARARDLARLPAVMAALAARRIDLAKARVFAAELAPLGDVTACQIAAGLLDRTTRPGIYPG